MKLFVIILAMLASSFTKMSDPSTETVYGVWKGYFGTENQVNSITIKINPQNKAEIFCNFSEDCLKASGTYKLIGDSAIVISYTTGNNNSSEVILHGNLNRTSSFIDGQWDGEGKKGGCFYLQKQFVQTNL